MSLIRKATLQDIPQMESLGLRLKLKTPYATVSYDRERTLKMMRHCVGSGLACAYVVDSGSVLRGFVLAIAQELWFSKKRSVTDLAFYSERPGAGYFLVKTVIRWAWTVPSVVEVLLGQSSGIEMARYDRLLNRLNFQKVGGLYQLGRHD